MRLEGKGRGARYRLVDRASATGFTYPTAGLEESAVWQDLRRRVEPLAALEGDAESVFNYALTELVNNAIDHSGSPVVEVEADEGPGTLAIEVIDRGVGIFTHVQQRLGLASELEALQELSKGKTTTMPARHTGEGLFFVCRAGDRFWVESGRLRWIVDNTLDDMAALRLDEPRAGTRARFETRPAAARDLSQLFAAYTEDYAFVRTRTVIKLFAIGVTFVSRSEARRLVRGLERFREVVLDFKGVEGVGQGFCDEVFRVWQRQHPEVRLLPVNMNEPVAFMVERARRQARATPPG